MKGRVKIGQGFGSSRRGDDASGPDLGGRKRVNVRFLKERTL